MAKIGVLHTIDNGRVAFHCPGCDDGHEIPVDASGHRPGVAWGWNGSYDAPTFTPSILVKCHEWQPPVTPENLAQWEREPWPQQKVATVCHSFVTDGKIQFLSDCTHALAGQVVTLQPMEDYDG